MVKRILFCLYISLSLLGCRSVQLGIDQSNMRDTLLNLYQEQVLDNLVRTHLNYPILQIDYSNITGTVGQTASGNLGQTNTKTNNTPMQGATGAVFNKVRTYVLSYGGSTSQTSQLTMTGQPVINEDSVYQAYVDALKKYPDIIKRADGPLRRGEYHLTHQFQGVTWYVPTERAPEFFKLYLATAVQRQTKVHVSLTVQTGIIDVVKVSELSPTQSVLEIRLKDKILNDSGKLTVAVNGIEKNLRYQPIRNIPEGQPTDRVRLINDETVSHLKGEELAKAIAGKDATLQNDRFVPGMLPTLQNQLESIHSQQELLRLEQFDR